jgi:hypothetical protein
MINRLILLFALCSTPATAIAQSLPDEQALRRHIEILASDDFEGRAPGTFGEALSANYIASEFAAAGIRPGYRGNFYQPVPLIDREDDRALLRWGPGPDDFAASPEVLIAHGAEERVVLTIPSMVFVGFAADILADEGGVLANMAIEGKTVLLFTGSPDDTPETARFSQRVRYFRERGAAAIIGINDQERPWDAAVNSQRFRQTMLGDRPLARVEAVLDYDSAQRMLASAGTSLEWLTEAAQSDDFVSFTLPIAATLRADTDFRRYDGINIVGRIPGTGDAGEAILFLAHHDHFGVCAPAGTEDRICNGAVDNASGTAALIETARALAGGSVPVRDIYFVATTAEESGLLGAQYFVENPALSLDLLLAVFNLDTIAIAAAGAPVGIVGRGMTPLDRLIDQVAEEAGRNVFAGLAPNAFVQRNDAWVFANQGVPAVMVGGSFVDPEQLQSFLAGVYHEPEDEIGGIELGGAVEDTWLHIALGQAFSDPERYPSPQR